MAASISAGRSRRTARRPRSERMSDGHRRIFVRALVVAWEIGAFRHERGRRQRVRVNVELSVAETHRAVDEDVRSIVSYDDVVVGIRRLAQAGHVNLVETLAERIAAICLADRRVAAARVRVEKLDVYPDAA